MFLSDPPSAAAPTPLCAAGLRVDAKGRTLLHPLDLRLDPGVMTVIAGPNGAGKTTLLEALAGVRPGRSGVVDGAGRIAFVPQHSAIAEQLPLTVAQLVRIGAWRRLLPLPSRAERTDAAKAMAALEIADLASRPVATLSGGQLQRALLAAALARRADVLLLDEPTTGLDAASSTRILAAVERERRRGAVVVCVSHDPVLIAAAGRVLRLEGGRLV
ncbi:zinc/manganese transport system ATP-binding protein [Microbacterium sp. SORGH_AS428]|uniref:ATP-binding cassette domain-containing protein n=1 Tax=Microbacterium sp. SORGH_AS_0428 TaxID=3041788 RepID=UPI002857D2AB|nr:ATP-binding cassette domain-containing protein [Microbacterium sp. SORGH_AS_0428]MDR6200073.1 zinc/manganese transport system ATP-binding protein [Microbacterium sp. SORGH_AS_0428]